MTDPLGYWNMNHDSAQDIYTNDSMDSDYIPPENVTDYETSDSDSSLCSESDYEVTDDSLNLCLLTGYKIFTNTESCQHDINNICTHCFNAYVGSSEYHNFVLN